MSSFENRYRPWLDDPAGWPDWTLTPEEVDGFAAARAAAGAEAGEWLVNLYGAQAEACGAAALVAALAAQPLDETDLQAVALTIAAADYHAARLTVPRARPGGLGNSANRRRWERLRPYLAARCLAAFAADGAEALRWRAILGRVPDDWLPAAQLTRALQQELNASELLSNVEVRLDLNPPVAGGGRWIAAQVRGALAELRHRLAARESCLVELIRDAEDAAPEWVAAYRLEEELSLGRDGVERVRLWVHDPRRGATAVSLRVTLADDHIQVVEQPAPRTGISVKALRLVKLAPADPPRFGWRRWFGGTHPWGALWWLKRLWQLRFSRPPE